MKIKFDWTIHDIDVVVTAEYEPPCYPKPGVFNHDDPNFSDPGSGEFVEIISISEPNGTIWPGDLTDDEREEIEQQALVEVGEMPDGPDPDDARDTKMDMDEEDRLARAGE